MTKKLERNITNTNNYKKESSQEPRFVLVVVYYRGSPICLRDGGTPFTNQDPTLRAMASNLIAMDATHITMASNLIALASNLRYE